MNKSVCKTSVRNVCRMALALALTLVISLPAAGEKSSERLFASTTTVAKKKISKSKAAKASKKALRTKVKASVAGTDTTIYEVAATQPQYPGGADALFDFLKSNIQYPEDAKEKGADGFVVMQFVVEKDGSLSDLKVIKNGKLPSFDAEAMRVCKLIEGFTAGRNENNQPVRVKYTLPVQFKLQ